MIPEPHTHRPLQTSHAATREGLADYLPRTKFAVVDANVLLKNISRDVLHWPGTSLMSSLASGGMYRLFAAEHVYGDVEDHLERVVAHSGLDVALGRKIWAEQYLPRIRFVSADAVELSRFDARIAAVLDRDPEDGPTAALAILLGTRVLSEDSDLLDPGLATGRPWLQLVTASRDVTAGESANFALVLTTSVSVNSVGALGKGLARLTSTTAGRVSILLCLAVICVVAVALARSEPARRRTKAALDSMWERSAPVIHVALSAYAQAIQNRSEGQALLTRAALSVPEELQELAIAARLLALSATPMCSREIARRMWGYERVPQRVLDHVDAVLRCSDVFVQTPGFGWQLGRSLPPRRSA